MPQNRTDADRADAATSAARALAHVESGANAAAAAEADRALRADPSLPDAHRVWALIGDMHGADDALIEAHLRAAVRLDPSDPTLQTLLGTWLLSRQAHDEALTCFDDAIAADARAVEAHTRRADVLATRGELAGAVASYRAALAADATFVPALVGLADSAERAGDASAARQAHEALVRLFPDQAIYRARLIAFYRRTGQSARAERLERELAQAIPKDSRRLRPLRR